MEIWATLQELTEKLGRSEQHKQKQSEGRAELQEKGVERRENRGSAVIKEGSLESWTIRNEQWCVECGTSRNKSIR